MTARRDFLAVLPPKADNAEALGGRAAARRDLVELLWPQSRIAAELRRRAAEDAPSWPPPRREWPGPPGPSLPPGDVPPGSLPGEEWRHSPRDVHLLVSSFGRLYSCRGKGRDIAPWIGVAGYPVASVAGCRVVVYRLVAEAFLPPRPTPRHMVRHLDGDRTNSRADNLAWGTAADNFADAVRHGTRRGVPLDASRIAAILLGCQAGELFEDVAELLGCSWQSVERIWDGSSRGDVLPVLFRRQAFFTAVGTSGTRHERFWRGLDHQSRAAGIPTAALLDLAAPHWRPASINPHCSESLHV